MQLKGGRIVDERQTLEPARAYQEYYGPAIFEPLTRHVVDLAPPRPGDRLLDIACGTGIATRSLAELSGPAGRAVGVDINPAMIDLARSVPALPGAPITWDYGDGTALDFPDASFDFVCCQQGLQFFADRSAGASEMRRVLADSGRAVVAVWRGLDEHPFFQALADVEEPHLAALGAGVTSNHRLAPFSFGDHAVLCATLKDAGFVRVELIERSILARFDADHFVEQMELGYAAVIPAFAADPAAFKAYIAAVEPAASELVEAHRDGEKIVIPMHTHLAVAYTGD